MKEKKQEKNKLKIWWKSKRGKACIKLGLWFFFFMIASIVLLVSNSLQNNTSNDTTKKQNQEFIEFGVMWKNLEENNFSYEYQITDKKTNEMISYEGKIEDGIDIGYRDSKIGIIKYKRDGENTYQINGEGEEIIENLYEEKDKSYILLSNLKMHFNVLTMLEEKKENVKIIKYQNEEETITIKTNMEKICSIFVETEEKEYQFEYDM